MHKENHGVIRTRLHLDSEQTVPVVSPPSLLLATVVTARCLSLFLISTQVPCYGCHLLMSQCVHTGFQSLTLLYLG